MYFNLKNLYKICIDDFTKIDNFSKALNDRENMYVCHHKLETYDNNGNLLPYSVSMEELKEKGKYWNCKASELIFMTVTDHLKLHRMFSPKDNHLLENNTYDEELKKLAVIKTNDWRKYNKERTNINNKNWQEKTGYYTRLCSYNGEVLSLNALSARFRRKGIVKPIEEAKKYLIENI